MTPLFPIYLLGAAAAAIPLILHLIARQRTQSVPFPTLRFLKLSNERTSHRRRIQNLLLLILRMLLFILLAFALAQFIVKVTEGSNPMRPPAAVVIVIDNSYSMAATHEGRTRYARAKEAALAVLDDLNPGDRVAILFTCPYEPAQTDPEQAEVEPDVFTSDARVAVQAVDHSRCAAMPGNVTTELKRARNLLAEETAALKEIYVLTDLQKLAWESGATWQEEGQTAFEREKKAAIPTIVIDCSTPISRNLLVKDVTVSGKAFLKNESLSVAATIHNPSEGPVKNAVVTLLADGTEVDKRKVDLEAKQEQTVLFAYEPTEAAAGTLEARVFHEEDVLDVDNRRGRPVKIQDRVQALIVQDAQSSVEFLDQSYFLERALDPSISLAGLSSSPIQSHRVLAKGLTLQRLRQYQVVFLLPVRDLSERAAAALRQFVAEGGGLIAFAGDDMDVAEYDRLFGRGETPLLPLPLQPIERAAPDRSQFQRVSWFDDAHPIFSPFRGENVMREVRVYKQATIDLGVSTPMRPLVKLENGQPLLLIHSVGDGKAAFFTVSAQTRWSNLPVTNIFLPLIHQLVFHVCSRLEQKSIAVGAPFEFPEHLRRVPLFVRRPSGSEEKVKLGRLLYHNTFEPGGYTYQPAGRPVPEGAFVVNPDIAESDLARIEPDDVVDFLAPATVTVCQSIDEMRERVAPMREGIPLRDAFVFLTLAFVIIETVVSNWVSPRRRGDEQPATPAAEEGAAA